MRVYVMEPLSLQASKSNPKLRSASDKFGLRAAWAAQLPTVGKDADCRPGIAGLRPELTTNALRSPDDHFLTIRDVCKMTTASRAWVYSMIAKGKFPRQIQLSARRVVWTHSSIVAYMQNAVRQGETTNSR